MSQGFLRSSRYSPGNMDRESLEALFVGRHDDMDDVLSRVIRSVRSPEKHYILLVGPRGSGKTHFLSLAYRRLIEQLEQAKALDSVVVAHLNEEEWGVASFLDLVIRILRAISEEAPELGAEIAGIYDRFSKDVADAETFAVARLRQHTRGKTLLLICENLVDLFDGLGEEGQKRWRATIQEDGNWTIVASTPSLFAAVTLQDNPFYGFFTIRALKKIEFETGLELLVRKAVHENKTVLEEFLRTPVGRARARAIHHLAAGNHRAYVVLFEFLDRESLEDLVIPFMHMVDDLTPYYQERMRQLPPAQRKIVQFLCLVEKPTTIKNIATPCLMSHQTAAKQIGELETAEFVSRIRSGRNTFCELSEPLMRICVEVKDNRTRHFRLFVEFLRHWFTTRELERRHVAFRHDDNLGDLHRVHVEEAVRCSLADGLEPFVDALCDEAERCRDSGDYSGLAAIQETLVRNRRSAGGYRIWLHALVMAGNGHSAIAVGQEAAAAYPDDADLQRHLAYAYLIERRPVEALSAIDRAIALKGEDKTYLCIRADIMLRLERFEEAIESAQAVLLTDPEHSHSLEQIITALVRLDRFGDAEVRAMELVGLAPESPRALRSASGFYLSQGRLEPALALLDRMLDIDANDQWARRSRGNVLFELGDYRQASEDLRLSVSDDPWSVPTHCRLADSLLLSDNFREAIDIAEHLIEIDPEHFHAHWVRGSALIELGRHSEAVIAFDELLSTDDHRKLLLAASMVRGIGDYTSAGKYLKRAAELQPDSKGLWIERTLFHIDQGAFEAAAESAARLEELPGGSLWGRLLGAQAASTTEPLPAVLDRLGVLDTGDFERNEGLYLEAAAGILTLSVGKFGPLVLPRGLARLQHILSCRLDEGVIGRILTHFLKQNVNGKLEGSLTDWEATLESLALSLADLPDCRIPIKMLQAAVKYTKTGDARHLLGLPREQRQLLEEIMPPATV